MRTRIGCTERQPARIAGYGAPAKATVLLNYCHVGASDLAYVVDRNEAKQGQRTIAYCTP